MIQMNLDDMDDDFEMACRYEESTQHRFGRNPARSLNYQFRVLSWNVVDDEIIAEDPKYFGILHEEEAVQYGFAQARKGLNATVVKMPTLDAMDRRAGLKTTEVWSSLTQAATMRAWRLGEKK